MYRVTFGFKEEDVTLILLMIAIKTRIVLVILDILIKPLREQITKMIFQDHILLELETSKFWRLRFTKLYAEKNLIDILFQEYLF